MFGEKEGSMIPTTVKAFLVNRRSIGFLVLLAMVAATTAFLRLSFHTFDKGLRELVYVSEAGAIPMVTLKFDEDLSYEQMQIIAKKLKDKFDLQYLYCGKQLNRRLRFSWDKFGGVSHDLDVNI